MVQTLNSQGIQEVRPVTEALAIAFVATDHVSIELRNSSPQALNILSTALKTLPAEAKLTLDVRKFSHPLEQLTAILIAVGGESRTVHVSPELYVKLRAYTRFDDHGSSHSAGKFRWGVVLAPPPPVLSDCRELSAEFISQVASAARDKTTHGDVLKLQHERVEKARAAVREHFSVEKRGEVYEVTVKSPPNTSGLREAFSQALKDELPEDSVCRIDLRALGQRDINVCAVIAQLCALRKKLSAPPLELVVPTELQRQFPPDKGQHLGYKLVKTDSPE